MLFNNNIVNEITKYLTKIPTKQQIQILHNDIIQFNVLSYLILPSMHIHTLNNNTKLCWNNRMFPISQNNNEIGYDLYDKIKKLNKHKCCVNDIMCIRLNFLNYFYDKSFSFYLLKLIIYKIQY